MHTRYDFLRRIFKNTIAQKMYFVTSIRAARIIIKCLRKFFRCISIWEGSPGSQNLLEAAALMLRSHVGALPHSPV